ncbi:MAG: hypothetical protein ACFFCW_30310 [Candidatus Hodarchaeota archaeon]
MEILLDAVIQRATLFTYAYGISARTESKEKFKPNPRLTLLDQARKTKGGPPQLASRGNYAISARTSPFPVPSFFFTPLSLNLNLNLRGAKAPRFQPIKPTKLTVGLIRLISACNFPISVRN